MYVCVYVCICVCKDIQQWMHTCIYTWHVHCACIHTNIHEYTYTYYTFHLHINILQHSLHIPHKLWHVLLASSHLMLNTHTYTHIHTYTLLQAGVSEVARWMHSQSHMHILMLMLRSKIKLYSQHTSCVSGEFTILHTHKACRTQMHQCIHMNTYIYTYIYILTSKSLRLPTCGVNLSYEVIAAICHQYVVGWGMKCDSVGVVVLWIRGRAVSIPFHTISRQGGYWTACVCVWVCVSTYISLQRYELLFHVHVVSKT